MEVSTETICRTWLLAAHCSAQQLCSFPAPACSTLRQCCCCGHLQVEAAAASLAASSSSDPQQQQKQQQADAGVQQELLDLLAATACLLPAHALRHASQPETLLQHLAAALHTCLQTQAALPQLAALKVLPPPSPLCTQMQQEAETCSRI